MADLLERDRLFFRGVELDPHPMRGGFNIPGGHSIAELAVTDDVGNQVGVVRKELDTLPNPYPNLTKYSTYDVKPAAILQVWGLTPSQWPIAICGTSDVVGIISRETSTKKVLRVENAEGRLIGSISYDMSFWSPCECPIEDLKRGEVARLTRTPRPGWTPPDHITHNYVLAMNEGLSVWMRMMIVGFAVGEMSPMLNPLIPPIGL